MWLGSVVMKKKKKNRELKGVGNNFEVKALEVTLN